MAFEDSGRHSTWPKVADAVIEALYLMQFLVSELAQEELDVLKPGLAYPVWSPYDAVEAADTMLAVLKAAESERHA
jgi:hypothetical protein